MILEPTGLQQIITIPNLGPENPGQKLLASTMNMQELIEIQTILKSRSRSHSENL